MYLLHVFLFVIQTFILYIYNELINNNNFLLGTHRQYLFSS